MISKKTFALLISAGFLFFAADAVAFPPYVSQIPGGLSCGACHINPGGGGERNGFGNAYAVPHEWTADLCAADSDGDGASNGVELGDPDCMWIAGDASPMALSNPGDADSTPPADPPMGGEMPPAGGEMPPAGGEMPPAGGEMPPAGGEMPPAGGEMPPAGGEMPPAGGEMPAEGGSDHDDHDHADDDDDGGCSVNAGSETANGVFVFGLLALILFRRRRN